MLSQDTTPGLLVILPVAVELYYQCTVYCSVYITLASESVLAGSAGIDTSTLRVSTAITPTGTPPRLSQ